MATDTLELPRKELQPFRTTTSRFLFTDNRSQPEQQVFLAEYINSNNNRHYRTNNDSQSELDQTNAGYGHRRFGRQRTLFRNDIDHRTKHKKFGLYVAKRSHP
jgi:hypothetical protein